MSENTTPTKVIKRVSVSPESQEQICFLCTREITNKDYKRRLITSGEKKSKVCFNLELLTGKVFGPGDLLTNVLCRNCAEKNECLVKKITEVRSKLDCSIEAISSEKRTRPSIKRLSHTEAQDVNKTCKRALFADPIPKTRDASSQVDFGDWNEEDSHLTLVCSFVEI